jgi:hypothetical protein
MNHLLRMVVGVMMIVGLPMLLAGCTSEVVRSNQSLTVQKGEERSLLLDARPRDRKISVSVNSDAPVDIIISYGADESTAERNALSGKAPQRQAKDKVTDDSFEVDLPANQLLRVAVSATKSTANVQVKMKGK